MIKTRLGSMTLLSVGAIAACILMLAGCSGMGFGRGPSAANTAQTVDQGPVPSYLDFGDILIPREFKLDKKKTYLVKSSGMVTGVLALKGRVDVLSLVNFFKMSMPKDNWVFITSFEQPEKTVMVFQKAQRWSVINITGNFWNTYIEIAVAPSGKDSGSGLMKTQ
jgi:hypothetical protein